MPSPRGQGASKTEASFARGTLGAAALLTLLTSSLGLLTAGSKTNGQYAYNPAAVPLLAELLKLAVSWFLLQQQIKREPAAARITLSWRNLALFPLPSAIYALQNNLQFHVLALVDPATYQILGNLKIVTTGLLLRLCLRRTLAPLQWMALVLLTVGAATSQLSTDCAPASSTSATEDRRSLQTASATFQAPVEGYLLGALSAVLSALAAVYTEWLLKRQADSLFWQNCQLYAFGVLFNAATLAASLSRGTRSSTAILLKPFLLLQGFSVLTWLVVANMTFSGLLVSWIMRFADSIVKVYATSMAMLFTTAASVALFGLQPSLQMALGLTIACCSVAMYYVNPLTLAAAEYGPSSPSSCSPRGGGGGGGSAERTPLFRDKENVPEGRRASIKPGNLPV